MFGSSKSGFTLIEILVAIALVGLLATVVIPNFKNLSASKDRQTFIGQLNALTLFAWQQALITRKMHAMVFDIKKRMIRVEATTGELKEGKPILAPLKRAHLKTAIAVPKNIEIKNFVIEGYDEIGRAGQGAETIETFFYIMPDGLTQRVTINFIDTKDKNSAKKPRQFGLVLNPFNGQFKAYDSFQK